MKIWLRNVLCCGALVGGTALVTSVAVSQQGDDMSSDDMMKMWMEMSKPGKEHQMMAKGVGDWDCTAKVWRYPGAEPEVTDYDASTKSIMGGRYFVTHVEGEMALGEGEPVPFEGMEISGFNNTTGKYWTMWFDNFMTAPMYSEGTASNDGKTITYYTKGFIDPMTGQEKVAKSVHEHLSDGKFMMKMYEKDPQGNWWMNMEMTCTRE